MYGLIGDGGIPVVIVVEAIPSFDDRLLRSALLLQPALILRYPGPDVCGVGTAHGSSGSFLSLRGLRPCARFAMGTITPGADSSAEWARSGSPFDALFGSPKDPSSSRM